MELATEPLRRWIRDHKVTCETQPHYELDGKSRIRVGYDVSLFCPHPQPLHDDPGCPRCAEIQATLREVALAALPEERRSSLVSVSPYTAALHMRPETRWAPEVEVDVLVSHPGTVAPAGGDEEAYVREIQDALQKLGVRPQKRQQKG